MSRGSQPDSAACRTDTVGTVLAWLTGWPSGRRAARRGRLLRPVATAGLLLTAVAAWMLALVQPWRPEANSPAAVQLPEVTMPPTDAYVAAEQLDRLCAALDGPSPRPLEWNPFAAEAAGDVSAEGTTERPSRSARKATAGEPPEVLETLRALRLDLTLVGPKGTRWAVIDGREYGEGECVAGLEILEIQEGHVKLRSGGLVGVLRVD